MKVIVGGVIEKDGKYLLVQEAKEKCYQKWNIPAGHLDFNESIKEENKSSKEEKYQHLLVEIKKGLFAEVYNELPNEIKRLIQGEHIR